MIGVLIFWVMALVNAHFRRPKLNQEWQAETISNYLTGPDSIYVRIGFYLLGGVLGLWAFILAPNWWIGAIYFLAGIGVIGAAITKKVFPSRRYHLRSAGIAFAGIGIGDLLLSGGNPGLTAFAVIPFALAIYYQLNHDTWSALLEQLTAALMLLWLGVFAVILLIR